MRRSATLTISVLACLVTGEVARSGLSATALGALAAIVAIGVASPAFAAASRTRTSTAPARPAPTVAMADAPTSTGITTSTSTPTSEVARMASLVSWAWLAVCLLPVHNFIQRANEEAVGQIGLEPLFEMTYFAAVGILAIAVIRRLEPNAATARPPVVLYLLPGWALVSLLWSDTGPYALARGAELCVLATLAWATTAIVRCDASLGPHIARRFVRGFVAVTAVLVGLGATLGSVLVPASAENQERFTWVGAHPNGSALVLAIAIVMLVAAGPATFGLPRAAWALAIGVFSIAMIANHSRGGVLALVASVAAVLWLDGTVATAWRRTAVRVGVVGAGVAVIVAGRGLLAEYALRGRDADSLFSGNGRIGLWRIGFDAFTGPFDWVCGLGYGAARTVFVAELAWAKTAHNSVLSLLVSLGVVGVVLGAVAVAATVRAARAVDLARRGVEGLALTGFAVALAVSALVSDVMAEPNIGVAGIFLIAALVGPEAQARRRQRPTERSTVSHPEPGVTSTSHDDRSSTSAPR